MALTRRQLRFCEEYLVDLNASQAAIRSGYTTNASRATASQLLTNPNIETEVARLMAERSRRCEITQDMVLREYAKIGFANMADYTRIQDNGSAYTDLSTVTRDQMAAVQEITVDEYQDGRGEDARQVKRIKLKLADKKGALDSVARHLGMFSDKLTGQAALSLEALVQAALLVRASVVTGTPPQDVGDSLTRH